MSSNITKHNYKITRNLREKQHGHIANLIWLTGLSGSGKSTIANLIEIELNKRGFSTYILDGDNIRMGINKDLTFNSEDRSENIRRIAEISNLMLDAGILTIASFISPYNKDRDNVKEIVGAENYIEIYVNSSLKECERRDVKGLYQRARKGLIKNMTGISSPYEIPENPDFEVKTDVMNIEDSVQSVLKFLSKKLNFKYD
tara:strand:+ start:3850 stop:4452 length:603 start_codon:yes stop_codon:yes gene_type:complete